LEPTTADTSRPVDADVSVLRWPEDEELRRHLAMFALPRILLVEGPTRPPELLDELEDWMRTPADPADLRARSEVVRRRAQPSVAPPSPVLDDDGLLWMGTSWVALTAPQVPVVQVLLENLDRVVRFETVVAAYELAGGSGHPASVRTLLTRLGTRVRAVGLELITVRRRGVLLSASVEPPRRQG
jgi:hypothetical protein